MNGKYTYDSIDVTTKTGKNIIMFIVIIIYKIIF